MKVLILGASSEESVGTQVGATLSATGHTVILSSRSGKLGETCDINDPQQVRKLVEKVNPDTVIVAAGCFPPLQQLGKIGEWEEIASLLTAKSLGSLAVLDAAIRHGVKKVIFLAGSTQSNDPRFAHFTVANGAVWSAVQFAAQHAPQLHVTYMELGLVEGSSMGTSFQEATGSHPKGISFQMVANTVQDILSGHYPSGSRVTINPDTL